MFSTGFPAPSEGKSEPAALMSLGQLPHLLQVFIQSSPHVLSSCLAYISPFHLSIALIPYLHYLLVYCLSPSTRMETPWILGLLFVLFAGVPSVPGTRPGHGSRSINTVLMNEMAASFTTRWVSQRQKCGFVWASLACSCHIIYIQ